MNFWGCCVDDKWVVSGSHDSTVRIWNVENKSCERICSNKEDSHEWISKYEEASAIFDEFT